MAITKEEEIATYLKVAKKLFQADYTFHEGESGRVNVHADINFQILKITYNNYDIKMGFTCLHMIHNFSNHDISEMQDITVDPKNVKATITDKEKEQTGETGVEINAGISLLKAKMKLGGGESETHEMLITNNQPLPKMTLINKNTILIGSDIGDLENPHLKPEGLKHCIFGYKNKKSDAPLFFLQQNKSQSNDT